nr:AMP-binding protein [Mesorhizobium sp. L-8-3]
MKIAPSSLLRRESHFSSRIVSCFHPRPRTLNQLLKRAYEANPNGDAIVCGEERISWAQLRQRVAVLAAGLSAAGVRAGDRVAVMIGNRPEFVLAFFAISQLGGVLLPVSTRLKGPEVAYSVNDAGAVFLLADAAYCDQLPARGDIASVKDVFVVGNDVPADARPFLELLGRPALDTVAEPGEEDACAILYTSGTTGRPKGAVLTQLGVVHSSMVFAHEFELTYHDRSVAAVPLAHVSGLIGNVTAMVACAGALVILPEFKAGRFLKLAEAERITHTLIVPAMYSLMLLEPELENYDLSSWRVGASGGAPLPEHVHRQFAQRVPSLSIVNAYGATETTSPTTIMPRGSMDGRLDSVGKAVPGCEIIVIDDLGCEVPPGETGEVWIGGPHIVGGYWRNETATAESFTAGFWHSGDIGMKDADGFLYILDRKKDMIIRGGLKIFSSEVESVIAEFPGIVESAVVSKPCPVLGERVHCFVYGPAGDISDELRTFLAARLADYKVPETVNVTPQPLPRNANGKIVKRQLRDRLINSAS